MLHHNLAVSYMSGVTLTSMSVRLHQERAGGLWAVSFRGHNERSAILYDNIL